MHAHTSGLLVVPMLINLTHGPSHFCRGLLKAKLAKLRTELMDGNKTGGGKGEGFDVLKSGDARVALIGFPSVGKSTLLSTLTNTHSEQAAYEFTTLTCIPGVINYKDARIQLLDLPGIIEGAAKGKGRGRQVIGVARTSDLVIMLLDAARAEVQKELLTMELDAVGIRINQKRPNITIRHKKTGGVSVTSTCGDLTHIDVHQARNILHLYKIHNVEVLIREDITVDQFIDVIEGNRVYLRCLYVSNRTTICFRRAARNADVVCLFRSANQVINKIDCIHLDEVDRLAHSPNTVVISCKDSLNLDLLLDKIWEYLDFIRIYTKVRGKRPDFSEPLIMRNGASMEHICHAIHREMVKNFKYALVWGTSAKQSVQSEIRKRAGGLANPGLSDTMIDSADWLRFLSFPVNPSASVSRMAVVTRTSSRSTRRLSSPLPRNTARIVLLAITRHMSWRLHTLFYH